MRILITGINGFVGCNLSDFLSSKHLIFGLDIKAVDKQGVVKTFLWDELSQIPRVDTIIHLAGIAHDLRQNSSKNELYFEINTGLTKKIFDFFLQSEAKKFIFFSTVKAASDKMYGDILTEYSVPLPAGSYGESKYLAECYINEFNSCGKFSYILRPCMIHGKGNKGNLNLLYRMQKLGLPWPLGEFENSRSFCAIDNLLFVIEGILENNIASGIYNVADDEYLSTNQIINIIGKSLDRGIRIWRIHPKVINILATTGSFLGLPFNKFRLAKLTENYIVSNYRIKEALKILKMPVNAKTGIRKTIESLMSN